jgi:hypothetical protein
LGGYGFITRLLNQCRITSALTRIDPGLLI